MEEDDPERRIAELESQLADQDNVAPPQRADERSALTPEDVHNLAFSSATGGRRGYHEHEVDAFLDRVEATLRDPTAGDRLTADDIRNVAFSKPPIGRRGYDEDEVDAFLDRVARELAGRTGQATAADPGPRHLRQTEESTAQRILNSVLAFGTELFGEHSVVTWRAPLVLGLVFVVLGFATHPAFFVVAGCMFVWAAFEWRTGND
jgi:DivIVA domain-containing protein